MSPEEIGAFAAAFTAVSAALTGAFIKMWTLFTARDNYRDAQIAILWDMIDLRDSKLEEVARDRGVDVNGIYKTKKESLRSKWDDLVRRGRT